MTVGEGLRMTLCVRLPRLRAVTHFGVQARASPSQRLRRIATPPLVARKDDAKVFNAFVLIFVLSAIISTTRHWVSRGQMINPPIPPLEKSVRLESEGGWGDLKAVLGK
jgi:hypothetical protein